ncbi:MAG: 50S ribosomal protein L21 [Nevskiales bacterium]
MHAVIVTGGKQYRVAEGDVLQIEKLEVDKDGKIEFDQVLLLSDGGENIRIGTPYVEGSKVTATAEEQGRADKVEIFKMRRRKHYRRHQGHRQYYTEIKITGIKAGKK